MRAVRIPGADPTPLGAPADWNEERDGHCGALFIKREPINGVAFMRSAWEIEPSEAGFLFAGARLILGVQGKTHPVVHMEIGELPADFETTVHARRFTDPTGAECVRVEMLFPFGRAGKRAFANVFLSGGTLAGAVATGVQEIEQFARREGWIE